MFFFRKILTLKSVDYYPSHLRLYRLNNKIIINLYYHVSKEDYYLNKIDLFNKNLQKKNIKKKKIIKKKKNILKNIIKKKIISILINYIYIKKNISDLNTFLNLE